MTLYETDHYTWTQQQAEALRAGRVDQLDLVHLAEEIEDMGKSDRRELYSYMLLAAVHLLKWQYQPERRGMSWQLSLENARENIRDTLVENPGLKSQLDYLYTRVQKDAIPAAARELGDFAVRLPHHFHYTLDQLRDDNFWPN